MKKNLIIVVLLVLVLLVGCASPLPTSPVIPTDLPSQATDVPTATQAIVETPVDQQPVEETLAATITVSTGEAEACVPPSAHDDLVDSGYETMPQEILDFLNAGASPEELAVTLIIREWGPADQPVWAEDLNNDGYRDVAVTVFNQSSPPHGAMLIYTCEAGQYLVSHIVVSEQGYSAPKLLHIQDINADGLREVVFTTSSCGAHTCYEDIQIISWDNGVFASRLNGSTTDLPYPTVQLTDFDRDAVYTLEVVGTSIASVGAGPQRDLITNWDFNAATGMWELTDQAQASSPFRIHLVHDADEAMHRGEYLIGSLLFQEVIEDDSLLEWGNPEDEKDNLTAYAYYRRVVAAVFMNDRNSAQTIFDEMQILFEDTDQFAYVGMAEAFLLDSEVLGLEGGCTSAQQYATTYANHVLDPISSATYGYANPDYLAEDICP